MSKPMITYVMLDVSCSTEYLDGTPDYALVPLTPEYVAEILKYMDIVARMYKKDDSIYSLERWDYYTRYLSYNEKFETFRDIQGNLLCDVPRGEPILLAADPEFVETDFTRVECQTSQISHLEVWWSAYIKHTNERVETMHLAKKVLIDIQRRFKQIEDRPA